MTRSANPARGSTDRWARFKRVPAEFAVRARIRHYADDQAASLTGDGPPDQATLERMGRAILERMELPSDYLAFAMVLSANAWWAPRLAGVPHHRRLLLLPRCLENVSGTSVCTDDPPEPIDAIIRRAEQLGYRTLIADGTPIVVKTLAEGNIEAVVGVACMDSLASVFDIIRRLGAPAVAVPLLNGNCHNTQADLPWLAEYVEAHDPSAERPTGAYLSTLQQASRIFQNDTLERLIAPAEPNPHSPAMDATGEIARQWLAGGGKRLRPFIALAAAKAVGGHSDDDAPQRAAVAIEAFHKASLAHDDIEDNDDHRYGRPTLHKTHGQAMAINVGDYLLGLGYRLIASAGADISASTAAAVTARMSRAHVHLAQGQGAELIWRREGVWAPPTGETLKVYALKTAPAFAAALATGVLMGGAEQVEPRLDVFARHIGVGFQVLNDLAGFDADSRAGRPTYLTALAMETANADQRKRMANLAESAGESDEALAELRELFDHLQVFETAAELVARLRRRAADLADEFEPAGLADLCGFLIELILK